MGGSDRIQVLIVCKARTKQLESRRVGRKSAAPPHHTLRLIFLPLQLKDDRIELSDGDSKAHSFCRLEREREGLESWSGARLPLQLLVGKVYAQLLKAVCREGLEAEDVEDSHSCWVACKLFCVASLCKRLQLQVNGMHDVAKKTIEERLSKGVAGISGLRRCAWGADCFASKRH